MQQIRNTLFIHRLRKITQDVFNPSFFILASIYQVYLSLYLDQYRWKVGFKSVTYSFVSSFIASKTLNL